MTYSFLQLFQIYYPDFKGNVYQSWEKAGAKMYLNLLLPTLFSKYFNREVFYCQKEIKK